MMIIFYSTCHAADTAAQDTASSDATVTLVQANSWESGDRHFYQYDITFTNGLKTDLNGWSVTLDLVADPKCDNFWNCRLSIDGKSLTLSNVDYNKQLKKGEQAVSIGCIINYENEATDIAGTYQYNSDLQKFERTSDSVAIPSVTQQTNEDGTTTTVIEPVETIPEVAPSASAGSAYDEHGNLSVKGIDLVDKDGKVFQLKGVSTHGLAWFPEYVNEDAFRTLRDNWGINTVRLAMYTQEYHGYCTDGNQKELEQVIDKGVKAAANLGMYVIIDWHILSDGDPAIHKNEAIAFFSRMSTRYKDFGNVLYELCNEPNGGVTWPQIKAYAEEVIPVIRENTDAVILVGTPTWSQDVEQVIGNEVSDPENVMYTLHFYAGTHKDNIRSKLTQARAGGVPIFISEFSICDASGNGGIDFASAAEWKKLITENQISFCGWSLCNKAETAAMIKPEVTKTSDWSWDELSETGKWLMTLACGE